MAWGIECGKELPSVYSSVAAGRCWLDQVMSCYTLSELDYDNFDLRGADTDDVPPASAGGFTKAQCGAWLGSDP